MPIFASLELGARLEAAERSLIADAIESMRQRHPDSNAFCIPVAGAAAAYGGDHSPLNKVVGLGFAGIPDAADLDAIEEAYAERQSPVQVELSSLADPAIGMALSRRGYELRGFENVLGLRLPIPPPMSSPNESAIDVDTPSDDEEDEWLDVVVNGFLFEDSQGHRAHESFERRSLEDVIREFTVTPGMRRFTARLDGASIGGASMRTGAGVAQLCGASTLPQWRRRGAHSAMLTARLRAAGADGCDIAIVTTLPGSKSQENVQKRGFELLYNRAILVRPME